MVLKRKDEEKKRQKRQKKREKRREKRKREKEKIYQKIYLSKRPKELLNIFFCSFKWDIFNNQFSGHNF